MTIFRSISALLAAAVLAGCGGPAATMATARGAQGLAAKASPKDLSAVIAAATNPTFTNTQLGVTAVLRAPTDVTAQRGLESLYNQAIDKALPTIDRELDEAVHPGVMANFQKQYPAVTDPEVQAYVDGIAAKLAKAAGSKPFKVYVSQVPWADAFNAGGHAMMLFSELIRSGTADEAELAGIMAHEMVHGLKRHMVQGSIMRLSQNAARARVAQINPLDEDEATLARSYITSLPAAMQADDDAVLGHLSGKVGADTFANVRFWVNDYFATTTVTRTMEAQADALGVRILSAAGYDPASMARSFERMNQRPAGDDRYYDHPALGSRAGAIKEAIAKLGLKPGERGEERHKAIQARLQGPTRATSETYAPPADAAGHGCVHGRPHRSIL